jgi:aspartyl aminopeptidase
MADHTAGAAVPSPDQLTQARDLCAFIDVSPSPFHVVRTAAARLGAAGFEEASEEGPLPGPGAHFLIRGGSLVAWRAGDDLRAFRMVGAHTDSPNLRIKPRPELNRAGLRQLGVEVYGGALLNSWLDRDLGLSGRVATRSAGQRLLQMDRPLLRIPQLAIHLDRDVNEKGLVLNRQQHLAPLWAMDGDDERSFAGLLASELCTKIDDLVAWDLMVHPIEPSRLAGAENAFVSAPRIDNQLSCWAGVGAMCAAGSEVGRGAAGVDQATAQVLVLFDHEEVGSTSDRGADGGFLASVLERVAAGCGLERPAFLDALARSLCVSADCAHATNPNYVDRHEPNHTISLNGGPVLKLNSNLRYATDATTAAVFVEACVAADVPVQWFVNRTDLACGSTIGPLTAAALAVPTVDVGAPQLAMHSARELCGSADPGYLLAALAQYLRN